MTALHELAAELGVEREWRGVDGHTARGHRRHAARGVRRARRRAWTRPDDAAGALRARRADTVAAGIEPVAVAWDATRPRVVVYRSREHADATLQRDDRTGRRRRRRPGPTPTARCARSATAREPDTLRTRSHAAPGAAVRRARAHGRRRGPRRRRATVLAAPSRPAGGDRSHRWGIFAPLYALHDRERPAAGDFGSLRRFATWAGRHGADLVGTLPLLATFVGHGREPCDPSPYAPVSRRFWNEAYLDRAAPIAGRRRARDRSTPADPRRAARRPASRSARPDPRRRSRRARKWPRPTVPRCARWLAHRPRRRRAYARFRAEVEGGGERRGRATTSSRSGAATRSSTALAAELRARGQSLFLDFPVGSHRDGLRRPARRRAVRARRLGRRAAGHVLRDRAGLGVPADRSAPARGSTGTRISAPASTRTSGSRRTCASTT